MRRFLRWSAGILAGIVLVAAVLYLFGLRLVPYGGGFPRLEFTGSASQRDARVDEHRAAQRASASGTVAPPVEAPAPAPASTAAVPSSDPVTSTASSLAASASWPAFRGVRRDGRYDGPIRTEWPAGGLTPLWKQPIGGGHASFAIAGGRAFTIEQRRNQEVVAAYDVMTGRELWTHAWNARFSETLGGEGPRTTPTWHDGVVYALGGEGELRALHEATGKQIWRVNILDAARADNLQWGMSASPLVVGDTIIVLPGGSHGKSVVAYDRRTGEPRWSVLDDTQAYTSPMIATLAGAPQLLVVSASRLMGLQPDTGALLWSQPWQTMQGINAAQPVVLPDDRVFYSSGYSVGAAVFGIQKSGGGFTAAPLWRSPRMKNRFASSVYHDGHIYGFDEGIFACIDAETGEQKWKGGRYGYGQVILAGDRLIVLSEDGELVLLRATPERHDELSSFPAISGKTWNPPAAADGILLVRNASQMAAFRIN
jgi:outer membrane protein assembly factor BamB